MNFRENIIKNYVESYNQFDIDHMTAAFDDNVIFENIQNGEVNMSLKGVKAFRHQAEQAKNYFSERIQKIRSFNHINNLCEIEIDYHAILASDLPNGLKKGEPLHLSGKSIFEFQDGKIIKLTDIS